MKMFLSGIEASKEGIFIESKKERFKYILFSYFYIKETNKELIKRIIKKSETILIDSGAHSFQKGKKVNWLEYTENYGKWIEENDEEKILGYFEMDIDPAGYSYEFVKVMRDILLKYSDKIIPVWHKGRGIEDFKDMCKNPIHKDKIIAITGFKNGDIKDSDYEKFLKYAWDKGCKVHCLGMTRKKIIDKVPFDFVDSSSWKQSGINWKVEGKKVNRNYSDINESTKERTEKRGYVMYLSFLEWEKKQVEYFEKWNHLIKKYKKNRS